MTTSTAKKTEQEIRQCRITVSSNGRRSRSARHDKSLRLQKLAGSAVIAVSLAAVFLGGELTAAAVMIPPALAAVFSKEKILDFDIFSKN